MVIQNKMETRQRYYVGILTFDNEVVAGSLENGELIDNNAYEFKDLSYGIYHAYVDLIGEEVVSFGFANANLNRTNKMVKQDKKVHISTATFGVFNEPYLTERLEDEEKRAALKESILGLSLDNVVFSGAKIPFKLIDNEMFVLGINHPSGEFDCLIERNRQDEIVAVEIVLDASAEESSVECGYKVHNTPVIARNTPTEVEVSDEAGNAIQGPVITKEEDATDINHDNNHEEEPEEAPFPTAEDDPGESIVIEDVPTVDGECSMTTTITSNGRPLSNYTTDDLIREILRRFL